MSIWKEKGIDERNKRQRKRKEIGKRQKERNKEKSKGKVIVKGIMNRGKE